MKARIQNGIAAMMARGLPHVMVANIAQQGVAFIGVLLIAKLLPPHEFALVRIALAYAAIGTVLAAGGITAPVLRYCADIAMSLIERRALLAVGIRRVLVISAGVSVGALGLLLAWPMDKLQAGVFASYVLQLPGLALASLLLVYLQANQQFKALAFYQVMIRVVTLVLTVGAVYWFGLAGLLVAACVTAYLICVPLLTLSRPLFRLASAVAVPADFSSLAFYSVFGTAVTALGQYADVIMLDFVGTQKEMIAVYSLATVFFFAAVALGGAVQSVATPMFTALIHDPALLKKRLLRWSTLLSAAAVPVAVGLVLLARAIETWFLGDSYAGLSNILAILMLKFFLWSTFAIGGAALVGVGAIKQGAWIAVFATILTFTIGLPLCERYGIYGAAWTQVLVTVVSAVLIWWVLVVETRALHNQASRASSENA